MDQEIEKDHLFQEQKEQLYKLKEQGLTPYGQKFEKSGTCLKYTENYEEGMELSLAGRVMSVRNMGKTRFWDLRDTSGRIQLFINPKVLNEDDYNKLVPAIGAGDIIGVKGSLFKTRTDEISVRVTHLTLLSKALRALPEKFHGLKDVESRFRQRYLDLISNNDSKEIFISRSKIIKTIRNILENMDFLEVETPMLQSIHGGAQAKPFMTHHNSLNMELSLRIAPELYLKRLLVGGFEKVYEINRSFRNEGLSRKHNPEFTMLELYSAYDNFKDMMNLCEKLIKDCGEAIGIKDEYTFPSGEKVPANKPFDRISIFEAVKKYADVGLTAWSDLREIGQKKGIENWDTIDEEVILVELFERYVEEKLIYPTFITDFPAVLSPLAKPSSANNKIAERFELYIDGNEIANAYSELNDPLIQLENFKIQLEKGNKEETAKQIDFDYVRALEHGMPPAGGLGIGIDRLVMILTGATSIREVILFPLLKSID